MTAESMSRIADAEDPCVFCVMAHGLEFLVGQPLDVLLGDRGLWGIPCCP